MGTTTSGTSRPTSDLPGSVSSESPVVGRVRWRRGRSPADASLPLVAAGRRGEASASRRAVAVASRSNSASISRARGGVAGSVSVRGSGGSDSSAIRLADRGSAVAGSRPLRIRSGACSAWACGLASRSASPSTEGALASQRGRPAVAPPPCSEVPVLGTITRRRGVRVSVGGSGSRTSITVVESIATSRCTSSERASVFSVTFRSPQPVNSIRMNRKVATKAHPQTSVQNRAPSGSATACCHRCDTPSTTRGQRSSSAAATRDGTMRGYSESSWVAREKLRIWAA